MLYENGAFLCPSESIMFLQWASMAPPLEGLTPLVIGYPWATHSPLSLLLPDEDEATRSSEGLRLLD